MNATYSTFIALVAASLLMGTAISANAQSNMPPPAPPPAGGPQAGGPPAGSPPGAPAPADATQNDQKYSVLMVTSVEVIHSDNGSPLDIIRVRGLTSSDGWSDPELLPLTQGVPEDGILNLVFVAHSPSDNAEPTGFSPIEVLFPIESSHPNYKGVRVYGETNSVTVKTLPGYAEQAPAIKDCGDCIGKYYVAKGAAVPAGAKPEDVVRQEDLPNIVEVIRPSEGISTLENNPNHLILILGEDGKIVDAVWQ